MLKAAIIACTVCAGAGGTALWVNVNSGPTTDGLGGGHAGPQQAVTAMPTYLDAHNNAYVDNLPVQTVKEPF